MTRKELKLFKDKKAIGHYDFIVTNCIYNSIMIVDVIIGYNSYIVYYPDSSSNNENIKKLRYAKINDNNTISVIDFYGVKHSISYNKILRIGY